MGADRVWDCTVNSPRGAGSATITLSTDGSSLSCKMVGTQGRVTFQEFEDGSIDGNNLAWTMGMTSPMLMTVEVSTVVDGDSISGNIKLGIFGKVSFSVSRS